MDVCGLVFRMVLNPSMVERRIEAVTSRLQSYLICLNAESLIYKIRHDSINYINQFIYFSDRKI